MLDLTQCGTLYFSKFISFILRSGLRLTFTSLNSKKYGESSLKLVAFIKTQPAFDITLSFCYGPYQDKRSPDIGTKFITNKL